MFSRKENVFREGVDTLVGVNTMFVGNIESDGTVRIDGKVKGDVKAVGDVYVGSDAVINGNIAASNVHLSGTVEGNITCSCVLRLLATAKLYGDIKVNSFVADEGALFQGKCSMADAATGDKPGDKPASKKAKDYKKSSVLDDVNEEKENANQVMEA